MKTLIASILALTVLGATAANAQIGVRIGPVGVGVGVGHYYYHHHHYGHRRWERDHYRYW
jgi:hypothetical protein